VSDAPIPLGESLEVVVRSLRPVAAMGGADQRPTVVGGVFGRWTEAVGEALAAHVQPVRLDGTHLVVEVDDPAWATQFAFFDATVRQRLAEVAGATVDRIDVRVSRRGRR
jgi:hypothetical protein